jgi:hypothetical protein
MARTFGNYNPVVPLLTTWEESLVLEDETGTAINLTGYDVRAQLRSTVPATDPATHAATTDPLLELTTSGYYSVAPAWPVYAGFTIPTPANGTILLSVPYANFRIVSPTNTKTKLFWDLRLVNKSTSYTIPVVSGKVAFTPATTV